MDISVVVPTYNSSRFIEAALDSIAAQSLAPREIIVIDDGSTDDTFEHVQRWQTKTKLDVTLLKQTNQGVSAARNHGIRNATGDWIALLDADDIWLAEHLTRLAEAVHVYTELIAVFADGVYFDSEKKTESPPIARDKALLASEVGCGDKVHRLGANFFEILLPGLFFPPSAFMFRRGVALKVGLFDESIKASEDREFILRLSRAGQFAFVDEVLAKLRIHETNLSHPSNATRNNYFALKTLRQTLDNAAELHLSPQELRFTRQAIRNAAASLMYSASSEGIQSYGQALTHLVRSPAFSLNVLSPRHLLRAVRQSLKG